MEKTVNIQDLQLITNIQKLREEKRLSRPKLAELVGVSWETIKAYEVKGAFPSIHVAFKLAVALGCKVDDLFSYSLEAVTSVEDEVMEELEME